MVLSLGKYLVHVMFVLLVLGPTVGSQPLVNVTEIRSAARALDAMLQDYAYRAFVAPRTGVSFEGSVPKNLTGIRVSALRLRSGSLFARGVSTYKEFEIPVGVIVQPYVERLVLVYQNLGNWSEIYYPLSGYVYMAPMLGFLAYDASDLLAKNLPELGIFASGEPISIDFGKVKPVPDGLTARCVWVGLDGQVNFTNVVSGNKCFGFKQGHFSIVVNSTASLAPPSPSPKSSPPAEVLNPGHRGGGVDSAVWVVVGSVVGGCLLLVLLALLVLWVRGFKKRKKMHRMERTAERGEPLHMTTIGGMKAPAAIMTRTQPTLETEYAP